MIGHTVSGSPDLWFSPVVGKTGGQTTAKQSTPRHTHFKKLGPLAPKPGAFLLSYSWMLASGNQTTQLPIQDSTGPRPHNAPVLRP
jgi:hypothetical protein